MQNKQILNQQGFTLIEMMIVVAIVAVLAAIAVPSFNDFFEKNRLKRAAEEVYGLLVKAKAETVVRNLNLSVSADTGAWCVGYATTVACDCTETDPDTAGACAVPIAGDNVLQVIDGAAFTGVTVSENFAGSGPTFNSVRGTAGGGRVSLVAGNWALDVVVSGYGRVRICGPNSNTMGYGGC